MLGSFESLALTQETYDRLDLVEDLGDELGRPGRQLIEDAAIE